MQIEGRNPVVEALRAGTQLNKIFLEEGVKVEGKVQEIVKLAYKKKIKVQYLPKHKLNKMSKTSVHQGVIAEGLSRRDVSFEDLVKTERAFLIYIREALYEHNIGAIIRTAECAGATGIVLPPKISVSPQMRRASMGASEHVPIVNYSLFQAIKMAQDNFLQVVGIERDEKAEKLYNTTLERPIMLIIGGEDKSLSDEIKQKCDKIVEIPMSGKVNSLNMSVAAALVIYDVVRQEMVKS